MWFYLVKERFPVSPLSPRMKIALIKQVDWLFEQQEVTLNIASGILNSLLRGHLDYQCSLSPSEVKFCGLVLWFFPYPALDSHLEILLTSKESPLQIFEKLVETNRAWPASIPHLFEKSAHYKIASSLRQKIHPCAITVIRSQTGYLLSPYLEGERDLGRWTMGDETFFRYEGTRSRRKLSGNSSTGEMM